MESRSKDRKNEKNYEEIKSKIIKILKGVLSRVSALSNWNDNFILVNALVRRVVGRKRNIKPNFVRKVLKDLEKAGLVKIKYLDSRQYVQRKIDPRFCLFDG